MSFINWGHETPEQKAFRKRLEEQALFQNAISRKIFEARGGVSSAAAAGATGSGNIIPQAIQVEGKCFYYVYYDETVSDMVAVVTNYDEQTISDPTPLGIGIDTPCWFEIVDGKGVIAVFYDTPTKWFSFIDAGGNLIKTFSAESSGESNWGSSTRRGLAAYVWYRNESTNSIKVHWWSGDKIGTATVRNTDYLYSGEFDESVFADGTINLYDANNNVYLARPDGKFIEITDKVKDNGNGYEFNTMSLAHNYVMLSFSDGVKNNKLRAISSEGSILGEWDISSYSANNLSGYAYGTNKCMLIGTPNNTALNYSVFNFDGTDMLIENSVGPVSAYESYTVEYDRLGGFTRDVDSVSGSENATVLFYNYGVNVGAFTRYDKMKLVFKLAENSSLQIYSFTIGGGQTLGFYWDGSPAQTPTYLVNRAGTTTVEALFLTSAGGILTDLGVTYAHLGNHNIRPFDNRTVVYTEDTEASSHTFRVFQGTTLLDDITPIVVSDYDSNYNTFFVSDASNSVLYYMNDDSDSWQSTARRVNNYEYADYDWGGDDSATQFDAIDNHYSGTTYFDFSNGTHAILTSTTFANITQPVSYTNRLIGKNRVYFTYLTGGNLTIATFNENGTNFSVLNTGQTSANFEVVSDRARVFSNTTIALFANGNIADFEVPTEPYTTSNDFDRFC